MKDESLTKLIRVLLLFSVASIWVLCLAGCYFTPNADSDSVVESSDLEFQSHRNAPPTAKTLYAMADILATQGKDSGCEFVLKRVIQEYPEFLPAYNSLAELQMRQHRTDEAIGTISRGLRIRPGDPVLLNNLGICWIVNKDYEKALEMFTRAADAMPRNARYRANMGMALGLMGHFDESLSLFQQVLPEEQARHNVDILREARENTNLVRVMSSGQ